MRELRPAVPPLLLPGGCDASDDIYFVASYIPKLELESIDLQENRRTTAKVRSSDVLQLSNFMEHVKRITKSNGLSGDVQEDYKEFMKSPRVLLVDDNDAVLQVLKLMLESHQFEVTAASSVSEAMRLMASHQFDALVSDLHLPSPSDGVAVVVAMQEFQPNAVTILVSGVPDVHAATGAAVLPADEVLVKPFDAGHLAAILRGKLGQPRSAG